MPTFTFACLPHDLDGYVQSVLLIYPTKNVPSPDIVKLMVQLYLHRIFANNVGKAPYHGVITHGFVLDERGLKMSKSLGNVVDPRIIIEGGKDQKVMPQTN